MFGLICVQVKIPNIPLSLSLFLSPFCLFVFFRNECFPQIGRNVILSEMCKHLNLVVKLVFRFQKRRRFVETKLQNFCEKQNPKKGFEFCMFGITNYSHMAPAKKRNKNGHLSKAEIIFKFKECVGDPFPRLLSVVMILYKKKQWPTVQNKPNFF